MWFVCGWRVVCCTRRTFVGLALLTLACFRGATRLRRLARTTRTLRVSRPSLSRAVGVLRRRLNIPLFHQSKEGVILAGCKRVLLDRAGEVVDRLGRTRGRLRSTGRTRSVAIAVSVFTTSVVVPTFLARFGGRRPRVHFRVVRRQSHRRVGRRSHISLCLSDDVGPVSASRSVALLGRSVLLTVPSAGPLTSRTSIGLTSFRGTSFVALRRNITLEGVASFCYETTNFAPRIVLRDSGPNAMQRFVGTNLNISFTPHVA